MDSLKKKTRDIAVSTKVTKEQNAKLESLAKKYDVKKGAVLYKIIELGYKELSKNKTF